MALTARDDNGYNVPLRADVYGNLKVVFGNILPGELVQPVVLAESGIVASAEEANGRVHGLFCATVTEGSTVTIYSGVSDAGTIIVPSFEPVAPSSYDFWGINYTQGCYVKISGNAQVMVARENI